MDWTRGWIRGQYRLYYLELSIFLFPPPPPTTNEPEFLLRDRFVFWPVEHRGIMHRVSSIEYIIRPRGRPELAFVNFSSFHLFSARRKTTERTPLNYPFSTASAVRSESDGISLLFIALGLRIVSNIVEKVEPSGSGGRCFNFWISIAQFWTYWFVRPETSLKINLLP